MSDKKLQQVKVLLLKDTLPCLEAALRPDDEDRLPTKYDLVSDLPFPDAVYIRTVSVKTPDWLPLPVPLWRSSGLLSRQVADGRVFVTPLRTISEVSRVDQSS